MTEPLTTADLLAVARPARPSTPEEVLLTMWKATDHADAERVVDCFETYGFELVRTQPLDEEQRARVEALRRARELVGGKTVLGAVGLSMQQASELVPLARYILTGHEAPLPPQRYLLGPLGDLDDQGDVADVLRTPEGLRKAMQTAAAARP